jgi:DNA-binding NarL/FixJ family response regulator
MMAWEGEEGISSPSVGGMPFLNRPSTAAQVHAGEAHEPSDEGDSRSQSTICKLPDRNAMITIAVIDEHSFTRECIAKSLKELCNLLDIAAFAACDECLRSSGAHDLILYHVHESVATQDNGQPLADIKKLLDIAPVIVLCDVDCIDSIVAAFESGARGYIPTATTTLDLTVEIIHLVKAGGTFVPVSSLFGRVVTRPGGIHGGIATQEFTTRQKAVLDRLKLGKTNKIIARELKMSESTVKVHIRHIMKKLNATNRTQVASRAHELEVREARSTD